MEAFKQALKHSGLPPKVLKKSLVLGKILENWEKIVGTTLKDWTKPIELREDTLIIGVAHSYLVQSFTALNLEILKRINALFKKTHPVKRIQIKVYPRLYKEEKKVKRSFNKSEVEKCFKILENLKDPELKEEFLKLFKVYFSQ